MADEIRHHSTRVRRRRRHRSSVTNINIFALAGGDSPPPGDAGALAAEAADEDGVLGTRMVSSEWLERRAKRLEKQEQELKLRELELEQREAELDEREARFEADMYLREDEIESRERQLADLEARLGQKESDLGTFVARVQGGLLADAR